MSIFLGVALGALALLVLANLAFGRLPKAPPAGGGVIETAHGPLHYVESVGKGVPIVFLHGMPSTCREFDAVRERLADRHTIAFDRPGYAWSSGEPQEFSKQLDAIVEAARTLGVDRAIVCGHSFGGMAALGLAIRHGEFVAGLLLLAPAAGGSRVAEKMVQQAHSVARLERTPLRQIADLLFYRLARKHAARAGAAAVYGDDPALGTQRRVAESMLARHNSVRALMNDRILFNDSERLVSKGLGRIAVPAVILHGDEDLTVPTRNARRLDESLANSTLIELPGDHHLPTKQPDQVIAALAQLEAR